MGQPVAKNVKNFEVQKEKRETGEGEKGGGGPMTKLKIERCTSGEKESGEERRSELMQGRGEERDNGLESEIKNNLKGENISKLKLSPRVIIGRN